MNTELLLLFKKHTDTLIQQTKTKPQATLEFKMVKQRETFSFDPPINLVEEGNWLLGVSSFECTISVFNITNENNSFSITIPGHWQNNLEEQIVDRLNEALEVRSLESHVEVVRIKGNKIKTGDNEYKLSDFDTQKNEILKEFKKSRYGNVEDLVQRLQLIYDEKIDILV